MTVSPRDFAPKPFQNWEGLLNISGLFDLFDLLVKNLSQTFFRRLNLPKKSIFSSKTPNLHHIQSPVEQLLSDFFCFFTDAAKRRCLHLHPLGSSQSLALFWLFLDHCSSDLHSCHRLLPFVHTWNCKITHDSRCCSDRHGLTILTLLIIISSSESSLRHPTLTQLAH